MSLDTTAVVRPDGSMDVVERVRYRFTGEFTVGIRSFEIDRDKVVDFAASERERQPPRRPTIAVDLGVREWFFSSPVADTERTFTVSYTVRDAVAVGPDVGELYWQFIGDDHPGIGSMTVSLAVPGTLRTPRRRHPTTTRPCCAPGRTVHATGWSHWVRPSSSRTCSPRSTPSPRRIRRVARARADRILHRRADRRTTPRRRVEEEGGFASAMTAKPQPNRDLGQRMAPVAAVTGVVGLLLLWFGFGRERRPIEVQGEYWREPLDVPPAVAMVNLARGDVDEGEAIAATIIDMAQRGYLTIEDVREERFGPDKRFHVFRWAGKPYDDSVRPFEKTVMEMVFHGRRRSPTTTSRLGRVESIHGGESTEAHGVPTREGARASGYDAPTDGWALGLLAVLCLLVGGSGALAIVFGAPLGWIAVVTAVGVFALGMKCSRTAARRASRPRRGPRVSVATSPTSPTSRTRRSAI